jgi:hypothetical protein
MPRANISNVHVGRASITSEEWCLSWDFKRVHYHVWLRDDLTPVQGVGTGGRELYKTVGTDVRYLHLSTPKNRGMFDRALALAKDSRLFEKAQEKLDAQEKERLARAAAEYKVKLAHDAGPEMLTVLQAISAFWSESDGALNPGALLLESDTETIKEAVQRVVKLATQGAGVPL